MKPRKALPYVHLRDVFEAAPLSWCSVWSRQFYCFEGEEVVKFCLLPRHMMELAGMHSFDDMAKMDVVFFS